MNVRPWKSAGGAPLIALGRARIYQAAACLLVLLSLCYQIAMEVGPLAGVPIEVDEVYFATCAQRGLSVGQVPVAGCHDNKGPLIFLAYQLLQAGDGIYSLPRIKAASFATVALLLGLSSYLAYRMGGRGAAIIAPLLAMQAFAADSSMMALKTDSLGAVFFLLALLALNAGAGSIKSWRLIGAGVAFGLAMLTKQTFEIGAVVSAGWIVWQGQRHGRAFKSVMEAALLMASSALPLLAFVAWFHHKGLDVDFLAAMFMYPSMYGVASPLASANTLAWRIGLFVEMLAAAPWPFILAGAALLGGPFGPKPDPLASTKEAYDKLLWIIAAVLLALYVVSPVLLPNHLLPLWLLAAILGSRGLSALLTPGKAPREFTAQIAAAVLVCVAMTALLSWNTNGGRAKGNDWVRRAEPLKDVKPGRAYVLGAWPEFYFYNQLLPASDVMFPWALEKAPSTWKNYTLPSPGTQRADWLARLQKRNVDRLYEDFHDTPPSYIVVADRQGTPAPSSVDVENVPPGFADYLDRNCAFSRRLEGPARGDVLRWLLFECRAPERS